MWKVIGEGGRVIREGMYGLHVGGCSIKAAWEVQSVISMWRYGTHFLLSWRGSLTSFCILKGCGR